MQFNSLQKPVCRSFLEKGRVMKTLIFEQAVMYVVHKERGLNPIITSHWAVELVWRTLNNQSQLWPGSHIRNPQRWSGVEHGNGS